MEGGLEYWSLPLASPNTQTYPMPNAVCSATNILCWREWECKQVLSGMGHCWALQCASIAGSLDPAPGAFGESIHRSVCAMLYSSCSLLTNLQYEAQYNYNANAMQTKYKVSRQWMLYTVWCTNFLHISFLHFRSCIVQGKILHNVQGRVQGEQHDAVQHNHHSEEEKTIQKSLICFTISALQGTNLAQPGLEI